MACSTLLQFGPSAAALSLWINSADHGFTSAFCQKAPAKRHVCSGFHLARSISIPVHKGSTNRLHATPTRSSEAWDSFRESMNLDSGDASLPVRLVDRESRNGGITEGPILFGPPEIEESTKPWNSFLRSVDLANSCAVSTRSHLALKPRSIVGGRGGTGGSGNEVSDGGVGGTGEGPNFEIFPVMIDEASKIRLPELDTITFCEEYQLSDNICRRLLDHGLDSVHSLLDDGENMNECGFDCGDRAELRWALKKMLLEMCPPQDTNTTEEHPLLCVYGTPNLIFEIVSQPFPGITRSKHSGQPPLSKSHLTFTSRRERTPTYDAVRERCFTANRKFMKGRYTLLRIHAGTTEGFKAKDSRRGQYLEALEIFGGVGGTGGPAGPGTKPGAGGVGEGPNIVLGSRALVPIDEETRCRVPHTKLEVLEISPKLIRFLKDRGFRTVGGLFEARLTDLQEDFKLGHVCTLEAALRNFAVSCKPFNEHAARKENTEFPTPANSTVARVSGSSMDLLPRMNPAQIHQGDLSRSADEKSHRKDHRPTFCYSTQSETAIAALEHLCKEYLRGKPESSPGLDHRASMVALRDQSGLIRQSSGPDDVVVASRTRETNEEKIERFERHLNFIMNSWSLSLSCG
ncbi:hypothetical protein K438DRAFT_2153954 [Mycena galopus ATCC 62051]|nr:hypothetical protein K438DRAFT_2153954 [Mycena galopus ATCC 62051]